MDVVVLEGIFLLRTEWRARYDLSFWIDCSERTALERALRRNQERLSPERLIADYRRIYFPAQRVHAVCDEPRWHADGLFVDGAAGTFSPPRHF